MPQHTAIFNMAKRDRTFRRLHESRKTMNSILVEEREKGTVFRDLPTEKLTREQETELSRRIRRGPNKQDAIDTLILHNLKEATIYSKHYCYKYSFSDGEIMSLCYDVLRKSAPRFKPSFGIRFMAFTKHRLRGAVKRYCCTLDVVKHASVKRTDSLGGPTFLLFTGGTDQPCPRREEDTVTCVQGGVANFDFSGVDIREFLVPLKSVIRKKLNLRQRMVLRLVYDLGFNMQEIGDMLDVSRSAVQMTHSSALEILRRELVENRELLSR